MSCLSGRRPIYGPGYFGHLSGLSGLSGFGLEGQSMSKTMGIDIGVAGALALLDEAGGLIEIADMPVLRDGPKNRASVNAPLLAEIVYRWHAGAAYIEYVGARPGEGAVGAFAFGRSRGVVEGVLGACGVPASHIAPASWKRGLGLNFAGKDASRSEAIRRWPNHAALFARVKDDGRAEAALIAVAGLLKKGRPG
jgi:hypothetical protein